MTLASSIVVVINDAYARPCCNYSGGEGKQIFNIHTHTHTQTPIKNLVIKRKANCYLKLTII
jgi:hypothetical protein